MSYYLVGAFAAFLFQAKRLAAIAPDEPDRHDIVIISIACFMYAVFWPLTVPLTFVGWAQSKNKVGHETKSVPDTAL